MKFVTLIEKLVNTLHKISFEIEFHIIELFECSARYDRKSNTRTIFFLVCVCVGVCSKSSARKDCMHKMKEQKHICGRNRRKTKDFQFRECFYSLPNGIFTLLFYFIKMDLKFRLYNWFEFKYQSVLLEGWN